MDEKLTNPVPLPSGDQIFPTRIGYYTVEGVVVLDGPDANLLSITRRFERSQFDPALEHEEMIVFGTNVNRRVFRAGTPPVQGDDINPNWRRTDGAWPFIGYWARRP